MNSITDTHRAKAKEINDLIRSQPPQVLQYLAETFTFDDEGRNQGDCIDEAVQASIDDEGYKDGFHCYKKQRLYCYMVLPDILIDIETQTDDDGGSFKWEFTTGVVKGANESLNAREGASTAPVTISDDDIAATLYKGMP